MDVNGQGMISFRFHTMTFNIEAVVMLSFNLVTMLRSHCLLPICIFYVFPIMVLRAGFCF